MFRKIFIHSVLPLLLFTGACNTEPQEPHILVSREYGNVFINWLSRADCSIERINMYTLANDSFEYFLYLADGIIISGGPDINPDIYGKKSEILRGGPIDHRRDTLELRMIGYALENNISLLCICRGHQLLNTSPGGTLFIDITSDYDTIIGHRIEGKHGVSIVKETLLSDIIGSENGMINSRHHQGVEKLTPG